MRKFPRSIYLLVMALLVFIFAGCGGSDDDDNPAKDKLMILSSSIFNVGEAYKLYRGNRLSIRGTEARYYVAPVRNSDNSLVTLNLEFKNALSDDVPFVITNADNDAAVVFAYNPAGTIEQDISTEYGEVIRFGGSSQQLKYDGLRVSGSSEGSFMASAIDVDKSGEVVIELNGTTATVGSGNVPSYNYVWHADPSHRDEYFTLGGDSDALTESEMMSEISAREGVYIAHDVRYTPSTVSFSGTARKDEDTEYVSYYSSAVQSEVAAELGAGFEGPYIFATLPASRRSMGRISNPNSNGEIEAYSTMTHTASEAYNNPVLHIIKGGVYRLKGTWSGQIWIDVGDDSDAAVILDGVSVTCTVAPALVFRSARECGPTSNVVSFDVGYDLYGNAGALVVIADGTTNSFKGSNVYRIMKADKKSSATKVNGTDISDQKKMYKMDGAFYSFVSLAIGAESNRGGGRLNITSTTYEGLDSEMHMLIDSGTITVTAEDDGINVNEDDTSVFTMNGGSLKVVSKYGDGIDSNGYIVINNGTLDVTAAQDSDSLNARAEGPLDADLGVYMSDSVTYTHQAYDPRTDGGEEENPNDNNTTDPSKKPVVIYGDDNMVLMRINYTTPVKDEYKSSRSIRNSDEIFILENRVNSFSGIRLKEEE